jgi:EmrB/QacA subfamily drug resistance transporter
VEYKWTALTVTIVGTLMAGLDLRIVIVGIPTISAQLHANAAAIIWITQAYVVASTFLVLVLGRIGDIFGRVKLYNYGFAIFTIGSLFCSLSPNAYVLIASRAVQGFGGGMLSVGASAIITDAAPKSELGTMVGINNSAFRVGSIAGLTLSGLILSVVNWRGLFWVNIPIGVFGTLWANRRLREISKKDSTKQMDWLGFGLFSVGLTLVLLAITYLSYGGVGIDDGLGLLVVGLVLLSIFVRLESKAVAPLLDLRLFKITAFAMGNIAQLLNCVAFYGMLLLVSFYLQVGLGYSPLQTGLGIIPLDSVYFIFSLLGGRLSDRYGARIISTVGLLVGSFGFFSMYMFGVATPYPVVAVFLGFAGIGNGLFNPPNTASIMGSVPTNRIGVASGFRNTVFNVGQCASYGLLILFITIGMPYSSFSHLLQGLDAQSVLVLARQQFLNSMRIAILILATMNAVAIIPSILRGSGKREDVQSLKKSSVNV